MNQIEILKEAMAGVEAGCHNIDRLIGNLEQAGQKPDTNLDEALTAVKVAYSQLNLVAENVLAVTK